MAKAAVGIIDGPLSPPPVAPTQDRVPPIKACPPTPKVSVAGTGGPPTPVPLTPASGTSSNYHVLPTPSPYTGEWNEVLHADAIGAPTRMTMSPLASPAAPTLPIASPMATPLVVVAPSDMVQPTFTGPTTDTDPVVPPEEAGLPPSATPGS